MSNMNAILREALKEQKQPVVIEVNGTKWTLNRPSTQDILSFRAEGLECQHIEDNLERLKKMDDLGTRMFLACLSSQDTQGLEQDDLVLLFNTHGGFGGSIGKGVIKACGMSSEFQIEDPTS